MEILEGVLNSIMYNWGGKEVLNAGRSVELNIEKRGQAETLPA